MRDLNWKYHKDDPNWPYDEFGFAKRTPSDHPARAVMAAIDILTGDADRVYIDDDYTNEFTIHPQLDFDGAQISVTTRDEMTGVWFDFNICYKGQDWFYNRFLSGHLLSTNAEYSKWRHKIYEEIAHIMMRQIGIPKVVDNALS